MFWGGGRNSAIHISSHLNECDLYIIDYLMGSSINIDVLLMMHAGIIFDTCVFKYFSCIFVTRKRCLFVISLLFLFTFA